MKLLNTAVLSAGLLLFSVNSAVAGDESLPAEQVIAAIQAAVAAAPGTVREAEVERKRGKTVVEVKIIDDSGTKVKVLVDPENNSVIKMTSKTAM